MFLTTSPPNVLNKESYVAVPGHEVFSRKLQEALQLTVPHMLANISPGITKTTADGRKIIAARGSVVAAREFTNPDYGFNWIRDSANVINAVIWLLERALNHDKIRHYLGIIDDYLQFTLKLQQSPTPYSLGESRFNLDGSVDQLEWSRPQLDGPGLRPLTMMHLLAVIEFKTGRRRTNNALDDRTKLVREIMQRDLDYLVDHWQEPCFDIWESYKGDYYATCLFALSAFQRAPQLFESWGDSVRAMKYNAAAQAVREHLDLFWRPADGILAYSRGPLTDVHGVRQSAPGNGVDAGVVMAAVQADVLGGRYSITDDRLLSTAAQIELIFANLFPINRDLNHGPGTAIGRHIGDQYYGGNAWFFLTAPYAELHYRLASVLVNQPLQVTALNQGFVNLVAERMQISPWAIDANLLSTDRKNLITGLRQRGDDFLWMIMSVMPKDGNLAEQFDKVDGEPRSANYLTWAYSSFIIAALVRTNALVAEQKRF